MTTKKLALSALIALFLSACGGGSGSDDNSTPKPPQQITYTALPSFSDANEGDAIRLSLNTAGDGANDLEFTWVVELDNKTLAFDGQGSDTITFTAPEVNSDSIIRVEVTLDGQNVFGFQRQSTTLTVADLSPPPPIAVVPKESETVTELDFSSITHGSTWIEKQTLFTKTTYLDDSYNTVITNIIRPLTIEDVVSEEQSFSANYCGSEQIETLQPKLLFDDFTCSEGEASTILSQQDDSFTVSKVCNNTVVATSEFVKKSDETITDFGSLEVKFENYPELKVEDNLCGLVAHASVIAYDSNHTETAQSFATAIRLVTNYEGSPFELFFTYDDLHPGLFSSLSNFPDDNTNYAQIRTSVYPEISAPLKSRSGTLYHESTNTLSNRTGEFNFVLSKSTFDSENIEGKFELILE